VSTEDPGRDEAAVLVLRGAHATVRYPVCGDDQEREFTNSTVQATRYPCDSIEFSVATFVEVDPRRLDRPVGAPAVERVAEALHGLFEWLGREVVRSDGPIASIAFEVEVGPFGDGDGYEDTPPEPRAYRTFVVSVPEDHRETARLVERLEAERPGVRVVEQAG
jgi:hypothetical protein